jgi:hypothetical protein
MIAYRVCWCCNSIIIIIKDTCIALILVWALSALHSIITLVCIQLAGFFSFDWEPDVKLISKVSVILTFANLVCIICHSCDVMFVTRWSVQDWLLSGALQIILDTTASRPESANKFFNFLFLWLFYWLMKDSVSCPCVESWAEQVYSTVGCFPLIMFYVLYFLHVCKLLCYMFYYFDLSCSALWYVWVHVVRHSFIFLFLLSVAEPLGAVAVLCDLIYSGIHLARKRITRKFG